MTVRCYTVKDGGNSMILCVDCGNTLIKIGSLEDGKVMAPIIRIETSLNKTMYEYASDIDRILRLLKIPVHDAEGVVLSSVVPPLTDILSDALHLITGKRALVVGVGTKTGLKLQIDDPGTVAADLVTAAVGAKRAVRCRQSLSAWGQLRQSLSSMKLVPTSAV